MNSTQKVTVIGHFGGNRASLDGQTIKTRIITESLERIYGSESISIIDTYFWYNKFLLLPFLIFQALMNSKNVIIFPAQNGLKVMAPLLYFENIIFQRSIHYCVIGGWLPSLLDNRNTLRIILKRFNTIFVETTIMQEYLSRQGFTNTVIVPNCKELNVLQESEMFFYRHKPYNLCTFSRVIQEKGIEDAINAISQINQSEGSIVYTLDIYGEVEGNQREWFEKLQESFPCFVRYKGYVNFNNSIEIIKDYFALLFPTRFYTEGIPGTIIDAYASGVPVIASRWESSLDVIDNENTGFLYEFNNVNELVLLLRELQIHPEKVNAIKKNCIEKGEKYTAKRVVRDLAKYLE